MCWKINQLDKKRHSCSHILAQAVQREIDPKVKLGIGPAIDTGFYYDFLFKKWIEFSEDNLKSIEKQMIKIIKEWQNFHIIQTDIKTAKKFIKWLWQEYKIDLLEEFASQWETKITFYINTIKKEGKDNILRWIRTDYIDEYENITNMVDKLFDLDPTEFVTFIDMCEWPHVDSTKEIDPWCIQLSKIAWAYWRWSEKNDMMTRIYAFAFDCKDDLKAHLQFLEEAKRRDHRVIWQKLKLFTISQLVWAWLPLLQPKGMILRQEIENYLWELHKDKWYTKVWTPHIAKESLYHKSWHASKFWDELFRVKGKDEEFFMKPMNCPHHMQIFADNQFSYRDLPIRYFEPATVYRDEKSWQLSWLTRVRSITQDDGHLFCRFSQIEQEVKAITDIIKEFYTTLWMTEDYWVSLSVRGEDKTIYLWSDEVWEKAEYSLESAAKANQLPYRRIEWEAAFYGPKLDFMFKDCLWREWQLATVQCDFNLPERFELEYTNEQWEKKRPVVIHRAISWSLERFMWIMIEHFEWLFPLWLAPEQIKIIPVADNFMDYANNIYNKFKQNWLRVSIDDSEHSFSKKIRNAELMKVNYILVIWEKEVKTDTVAVRECKSKKQYEIWTEEFIMKCKKEIKDRSL